MAALDIFFDSIELRRKIQAKLPLLFQIAEIESSRAGKIGMEVGSLRERVLVSIFISVFGVGRVQQEIPITEPEVDLLIDGQKISIKTISGKKVNGLKVAWTVDAQKAQKFWDEYIPSCDMFLVHINWGGIGALYLVNELTQKSILAEIGRNRFLKLPKPGTNPRGVELSSLATSLLLQHPNTLKLPVKWDRQATTHNPYSKWKELWERD